jgi:hypothetical protein
MLPRLLLAAILAFGLSASLEAQMQNQRRGQPQMPQPTQPVEIKGTIEQVVRGGIVALDATSQPWQVFLPANAKVQVVGGASVDYLRNGLFVEFQGEIDLHGRLKEKVDHLTIVTLSPEKQVGLFPSESDMADGEQGGLGMGEGLGGKPAKAKKAGVTVAGSYRIVGKLMVGRGNKLSVQTGRGSLPLELTEQPTVAVDVSDYSIAAKGDNITVKGLMMPNMPGRAQATEVKIELAEPLAGITKKKPEAKRSPKRSKKDTDEGLPE